LASTPSGVPIGTWIGRPAASQTAGWNGCGHACAAAPSRVACHHPLRHPAALAWRRLPVNTPALLGLLREEGVEAILSGHLHLPQVLRGAAGDPIQVITPSGLSGRGSGKCGWSLITLLDGRFTIHAREFRDGAWSAGAVTSLSEYSSLPAPAAT
jgi:hypothetical protein